VENAAVVGLVGFCTGIEITAGGSRPTVGLGGPGRPASPGGSLICTKPDQPDHGGSGLPIPSTESAHAHGGRPLRRFLTGQPWGAPVGGQEEGSTPSCLNELGLHGKRSAVTRLPVRNTWKNSPNRPRSPQAEGTQALPPEWFRHARRTNRPNLPSCRPVRRKCASELRDFLSGRAPARTVRRSAPSSRRWRKGLAQLTLRRQPAPKSAEPSVRDCTPPRTPLRRKSQNCFPWTTLKPSSIKTLNQDMNGMTEKWSKSCPLTPGNFD
jgi:hypothetical protein